MFIRSERLFLRPGWPEDFDELRALLRDDAQRDDAALSWPAPHDLTTSQPQDRLLPQFCITQPTADGARLLGGIGLVRDGADIVVACWIAPERRGQGYATEALRAVLTLARTLGHQRIVAHCRVESTAGMRLLHKTGFRPLGLSAHKRHGVVQSYIAALGGQCDCDDDMTPLRAA